MSSALERWSKKQTSDEFYTRGEDIDAMLPEWDLSDKIVYCPADSEESEFVKYFKQPGKCKELIYTSDDFRTHQDLFEKCDIVVTNPPFSLIKVLVKMIVETKKDFILIQPVLPASPLSEGRFPLHKPVFFFKELSKFQNTEKKVLCQWVSTLGTKEHPCGYSFRELFGKDYKICENPEKAPVVSECKGDPVRKYGRRTGFPPKDFTGWFFVTSNNNCSEFLTLSTTCRQQEGLKYPGNILGTYVKWRR